MLGLTASSRDRRLQSRKPISDPELKRLLARPLPAGADSLLDELSRRLAGAPLTVYLSTPITTGPRYVERHVAAAAELTSVTHADEESTKEQIKAENLSALRPLKARLRRELPSHAKTIDPTELQEAGWDQPGYHRYWIEVIQRFVDLVVFADGWQYSTGCALEYAVATEIGLPAFDSSLRPIGQSRAKEMLDKSRVELDRGGLPARAVAIASSIAEKGMRAMTTDYVGQPNQLKDDRLASLAGYRNVAMFASFSPYSCALRHVVLGNHPSPGIDSSPEAALSALMSAAHSGSLNVRSFLPGESKGSPFIYGLSDLGEVLSQVRTLAAAGYYTIVNETIDVDDGGVSGVSLGGIVEFAPGVTPRGVESGMSAQLPIGVAESILSQVYGSSVSVPHEPGMRVEFSLHPKRVGSREQHVCVWEIEDVGDLVLTSVPGWPNSFSEAIGDKTYGLMVASAYGARVPYTTVVSRRIAPFSFGTHTGSDEWWMRTAPAHQDPGRFTTTYGWVDPFELLAREDREGLVAAVLAQEGVSAQYSGATLPLAGGGHAVEAVEGRGDRFMLGSADAAEPPAAVGGRVRSLLDNLSLALGPVRIEWAYDGKEVWVLQMHRVTPVREGVLSTGRADRWLEFDPEEGLDVLRSLINDATRSKAGIVVTQKVGLTSHVGDLLRKSGVPGRFVDRPAAAGEPLSGEQK